MCGATSGDRGAYSSAPQKEAPARYIYSALETRALADPESEMILLNSDPLGRPASVAPRILMNVFHAAVLARLELLRAVSFLLQRIAKWDELCERRLHRPM